MIVPANIVRERSNKTAVRRATQTNSVFRSLGLEKALRVIVPIKLIAPVRCNEKIAISTDGPACSISLDGGGGAGKRFIPCPPLPEI